MSETASPTRAQGLWALAGVIPFMLSIALLGYALAQQVLLVFAIAWPMIQIFGYSMTLKMAKGDPAHYLVKSQVLLHWMVLALAVAMLVRN
jgi:hypothetical protein